MNEISTNWISAGDGNETVIASDIRIYPGNNDGVYEIEYNNEMVGITMSTSILNRSISIKSVSLRCKIVFFLLFIHVMFHILKLS